MRDGHHGDHGDGNHGDGNHIVIVTMVMTLPWLPW